MRTLTIAAALTTLVIAAAALVLVLAYDDASAGPVPPDLVVNTIDDPGDGNCDVAECTLREAITAANLAPGSTIVFNIPGCPPACTISPPTDDLPAVTADGTVIDGTSEPDYANTPIVIVDGSALASGEAGIYLWANDVIVRGLVIQNFPGMGAHAATGTYYVGREVHDSIIRDSGTYGIGLNGDDAEVTNNLIEGNEFDGIAANFAGAGTGLLVDRNEITDNGGSGITSGIADSTITDNVFSGNGSYGALSGGGSTVMTGNVATNNGDLGLRASGETALVTGNTATGNAGTGIVVGGGPATVRENISNDNGFGIYPGDGFEIGGSSDGKLSPITWPAATPDMASQSSMGTIRSAVRRRRTRTWPRATAERACTLTTATRPETRSWATASMTMTGWASTWTR
ncbi:MAG TPA: right-handed parallel beta-helix repeat-containing protein [Dehalococcoidia bacterium]|nr:right-handed parallel beta-helix repeat-containing protein [Dehalococcoidia bacterium]